MSVYIQNGYRNRKHYLESLAEDFGIDMETVLSLASILGKGEDFDGLVTAIQDFVDSCGCY